MNKRLRIDLFFSLYEFYIYLIAYVQSSLMYMKILLNSKQCQRPKSSQSRFLHIILHSDIYPTLVINYFSCYSVDMFHHNTQPLNVRMKTIQAQKKVLFFLNSLVNAKEDQHNKTLIFNSLPIWNDFKNNVFMSIYSRSCLSRQTRAICNGWRLATAEGNSCMSRCCLHEVAGSGGGSMASSDVLQIVISLFRLVTRHTGVVW